MIALPRQPDDPGIEFPANPYATVVFGQRFAELTPMTLKVIRKNAGRVPPLTLAQALCWKLKRLKAIAKAEGIDLHPDNFNPDGFCDRCGKRGSGTYEFWGEGYCAECRDIVLEEWAADEAEPMGA